MALMALAETKDAVVVVVAKLAWSDTTSEGVDDGLMEVIAWSISIGKEPLDVVEAELAGIQLRNIHHEWAGRRNRRVRVKKMIPRASTREGTVA